MQIIIWIIIILLVIFLIWLLRKWIRRIIFILILLALAFLIYWIFNPSWAARLWYNVRTFPQRITSWISSGKEFLDYDNYKLNIPSIWDKIDLKDDEIEKINLDEEIDNLETTKKKNDDKITTNIENNDKIEGQKIKTFPNSIQFIKIPKIEDSYDPKAESQDFWILTWYSKSDLFWVINNYLEKNLDDNTDILVTVKYEEYDTDPQKIILQTRPKKS